MIISKPLGSIRLCLNILRDSRAFLPRLGILFALGLASIPLSVLLPLPLKIIVDYALLQKKLPIIIGSRLPAGWGTPVSLIAIACALEFSILLFKEVLNFSVWAYQIYLEERIVADARARLFRHVQNLSIQWHDQRGIGDVFYRLQNDVASMHTIAVNGLVPLLSTCLTFVILFAVAFRMDAGLALLALGVLPVTLAISSFHLPRARRRWRDVKKTDQEALGVIQEALGAIRVVRAFSQEEREVRRYQLKVGAKLERVISAGAQEMIHGILTAVVVAAASSAAIYLGTRHVLQGRLSLGDFLIISTYLVQLFRPLDYVRKQTSTMQAALASAERYFNLLEEIPEIQDDIGGSPLARAEGRVEFQSVGFAYGQRPALLREVSFTAEPGQSVGVVGPTGAGKTTLINLLVRFLDPTKGRILLDGMDFRSIRLKDLRRQFSIVLQDPLLFSGSIAENIAYGRPDATEAEIVQAATLAEAHDFISRLPEGYETPVGERGMSLSGGERQRVSIARAFLTDAVILVLDEPTSNLDATHELAIKTALRRLKAGRTTFTVTHRLTLLDEYDLILKVGDGRVASRQGARPVEEIWH